MLILIGRHRQAPPKNAHRLKLKIRENKATDETGQIPIFAQWHIHSHAPIGIGAALNSEGLHGCGVHDFPSSTKAQ